MWNGTINVDNQSLVSIGAGAAAVASGLDVQSGATLSGFGSITGLIENDGGITASGGVLKLDDAVSGGGAELIDTDATLALFSGVAANQTVSFAAGSGAHWGTLDLSGEGTGLTFAAPISGFTGDGATASLSDVIEVAGSGGTDHVVWTQNTGLQGTLQIETSADAVLETLTLEGSYNQNQFTLTDPAVVDQITYNTACYARGTRILTQRGEIAIEALCIGDLAVTNSGALRPIVWLGHRRIDISRHPDPAAVQPVRVLAGAFGEALPRRDLWLSPGHNVAFEDALMPISCLINGRSVAQIKQASVEYWHVELDAHDIILAEGLPAEILSRLWQSNRFRQRRRVRRGASRFPTEAQRRHLSAADEQGTIRRADQGAPSRAARRARRCREPSRGRPYRGRRRPDRTDPRHIPAARLCVACRW